MSARSCIFYTVETHLHAHTCENTCMHKLSHASVHARIPVRCIYADTHENNKSCIMCTTWLLARSRWESDDANCARNSRSVCAKPSHSTYHALHAHTKHTRIHYTNIHSRLTERGQMRSVVEEEETEKREAYRGRNGETRGIQRAFQRGSCEREPRRSRWIDGCAARTLAL